MKKDSLAVRFRKGLRQWLAVLPFLSVGLVLFVVFVLYPQLKNIYIAFSDYSIMPGSENPFVGFENFKRAFTGIKEHGSDAYYFWIAFRNNLLAVLVTVPGQMVLGLLVAVMIHNLKFGKNIYKIIFYIDNLLHVKCDYELFKTFMSCAKSYNIKIIASIYSEDFENYFLVDDDLIKYLNPILVEEPEIEEIYPMLKTRIDKLQEAYGVKISEKMIRFSIFTGLHLSSSNSSNPESTLDVINFALADVKRKGQKEVNKLNILSYYYINFKLAKKTSKSEKIITACHEVGHYLVSELSKNIKSSFILIQVIS